MKISYNWLRDYLSISLPAEEVAEHLTNIGLEIENIETRESIPGGLKGLVVGEVTSCEAHPNADKLSVTNVDIGDDLPLPIVCGAPNVAKGQKVIVAPVGSTLYGGDEPFTLKKVKIRGEVSMGMICAEDELGIGKDHSGIIVLPDDTQTGTPASEYYNIETDTIFEIGLTPNRIDGASHIGTARDLRALLSIDRDIALYKPSVEDFSIDNQKLQIPVQVDNEEACIRYSGLTISGIVVQESPDWLKNRLLSIGLTPINNIVDITNYVLHETGQPLHAFDAEKISGGKISVKTLQDKTKFITLDEQERELSDKDLMICNEKGGMCIAGVFGGLESGITEKSTALFLESACFNPVWVRVSSKKHQLFTDSAFRFERGTDPNGTIYALKRAALLIKELAGGEISSDIVDIYPEPVAPYRVKLTWKNLDRLIGVSIDREVVKQILGSLDITIIRELNDGLDLDVATYRVDVKREADVIEEVLRIYGYNNIGFQQEVHSTLAYAPSPNPDQVENLIAEQLTGQGLNEIMTNSLTKAEFSELSGDNADTRSVRLFNPLSMDLNAMRQTLMYGNLETISRNLKHKNPDQKLYEFGNVYSLAPAGDPKSAEGYLENRNISLIITGKSQADHWKAKNDDTDLFQLKAYVENILSRLGIGENRTELSSISSPEFIQGVSVQVNQKEIGRMGQINPTITEKFEIEQAVYFAELNWDLLLKYSSAKVTYQEIPKYPAVRRDLALLLDKDITYRQIRDLAFLVERKLLKSVRIFDLFESEKIGANKKSLAIACILQDEHKTLTDKQIDKAMRSMISAFENKLGAQLR